MAKLLLGLSVLSLSQCAGALPPYEYADFALKGNSVNASFSKPPEFPLKFQSFYPQLGPILHEASTGPCLVSLQAYEGNLTARKELTKYGGVGAYCNLQNDCILSTIYESTLVNMAAATVLLGLTPTILASVGPAIAEVALLSSRRPLLSLLLSMGAPATYQSRFLLFDDPVDLLRRPQRSSILRILLRHTQRTNAIKVSRMHPWSAIVISFFQYAFALLAITNLITTSLELGRKTVVSWKCPVSWLPIVWAMTPIACHAPAVLSFELYRRQVKVDRIPKKEGPEYNTPVVRTVGVSGHDTLPIKETTFVNVIQEVQPRRQQSLLSRALRSEFTISANADSVPIARAIEHPGAWSIVLQGMASLFGILQIIFGTVIFSSLLYIGIGDATILLLRYAGSALSCRVIMYLELEGMVLVAGKEEKPCSSADK